MPRIECYECDGSGEREHLVAIAGVLHDAPCVCGHCDGTGYVDEPEPLPLIVSPEQCGASQLACDIVNDAFLSLDGFEPLRNRLDESERNGALTFASHLARVTDRHLKHLFIKG